MSLRERRKSLLNENKELTQHIVNNKIILDEFEKESHMYSEAEIQVCKDDIAYDESKKAKNLLEIWQIERSEDYAHEVYRAN